MWRMRGPRIVALSICVGLLIGVALLLGMSRDSHAAGERSPRPAPPAHAPQQAVTATLPITASQPITPSQLITPGQLTPVQPQPTAPLTPTGSERGEPGALGLPSGQLPVMELRPDEVLTGTILHNSSGINALFFVDTDLYDLPPNRAVGVILARPLAALSLYPCPPQVIDNPACDWVSVPIRRSAFYEIQAVEAGGDTPQLAVALAAPPALEMGRIQNRTGGDATILSGEALLPLSNTATLDLELIAGISENVHLSRCLDNDGQSVCEWLPAPVLGGVYYALNESRTQTAIRGVTLIEQTLSPLFMQEARMTPTPTPIPEPQGILCQTQIPSLNVRAGPGTSFLITGKLRRAEENQGRVLAIGRNETNEWLAVDPRFVEGGWVAFVPQWITCDGDVQDLPLAEITDGRAAGPAVSSAPPAPTATPTPPPDEPAAAEQEPAATEPAEDQAVLIATNAFDHKVRFTLDAAFHGLPEGTPSEYDLEPGESIRFVVRAGQIRFSASTPWRSGGGSAEFPLGEGATRELFLHFVPAADDPDRWEMRYE